MPKPLLDGFRVLLFGMFPLPGPAKSDLEFLLVHCGAALCRSVEQLVAPSDVSSQGIVICSSGEDSTDQAGEAHTAIRSALGDSAGAQPLVVSAVWLMDCVTNFTAVSPSKYLLP